MSESFPQPTSFEISRQVLTWPNLITTFRIILIPVFLRCILIGRYDWALTVFAVAGISDGLDGYLARRLNQRTILGQMLDPIGDKLLMVTSFLVLALPGSYHIPIPWWLTFCVIGRDIGIVCTAAVIYWRTGFRDFKPSLPGKVSTVMQVCFIVFFLIAQLWGLARVWIVAASLVTAGMTLFSGFHYGYRVNRQLKAFAQRKPLRSQLGAQARATHNPNSDENNSSPQPPVIVR